MCQHFCQIVKINIVFILLSNMLHCLFSMRTPYCENLIFYVVLRSSRVVVGGICVQ